VRKYGHCTNSVVYIVTAKNNMLGPIIFIILVLVTRVYQAIVQVVNQSQVMYCTYIYHQIFNVCTIGSTKR